MNPNILKTAEGIANKYIPDAEKETQAALSYDILRYLEYHRAKWNQLTEHAAKDTDFTLIKDMQEDETFLFEGIIYVVLFAWTPERPLIAHAKVEHMGYFRYMFQDGEAGVYRVIPKPND